MSKHVHALSRDDRQRAVRIALCLVAGETPDVAIGPTKGRVRMLGAMLACKLERGIPCLAEVL